MAEIRREYGELNLSLKESPASPFELFNQWYEQVLSTEQSDPTAMSLATVDEHNQPDIRIVLLKGINEQGFLFYTNYQSDKGKQLAHNSKAAINFYWPTLSRQIRIKGLVNKTSTELSEEYFHSRPINSQLSASVSPQSQVIPNRESLEEEAAELEQRFIDNIIPRPDCWGGYALQAFELEFWQGRDNRLHDRIHYQLINQQWQKSRLAP